MNRTAENLLALVAEFDPIGLEATNAQAALMRRVDTKYVLRPDQLHEILPTWTSTHRVLDIEGGRSTHYHNIYFDTPGFSLYHAHHAGVASRVKFRLREYRESNLRFYEIKARSNKGVTEKQRAPVQGSTSLPDWLHQSVIDYPRHLKGGSIQVSIQIDYDRITLVSRTGAERITIDRNLQFRSGDRLVELQDWIIVEMKHERGMRSSIAGQFRALGIRPGSISKYCLGVMHLFPDVKRNRFKLPLRILDKQLRNHGIAASRGGRLET